MDASRATSCVIRFGVFELDTRTGELRRNGMKVRLPIQSFKILQLLLDRPGELVTRDELRQRLWTSGTVVEFDLGLNSAIRKLREALEDSADNPRFVETLPRRGYRFIASVQPARRNLQAVSATPLPTTSGVRVRWRWTAGGQVLAVFLATLVLFSGRNSWQPGPGVDPEAYDTYLKGLSVAGGGTYEGFRSAVVYFEAAVARQPDFAAAYAALAQAQHQFLFVGPLSPRDTTPKAEMAARKALELDQALAQAHRTLGSILHHFHWRWEEGDREFRRARELSSTVADSYSAGVPALIRAGRFDEAIGLSERARKNDPLSFNAFINVASANRAAGQYQQAIREIRGALEINPAQARGHFELGVTFMLMGRFTEAIRELETAVASSRGGNLRFLAYLGYAYAAAGKSHDAREILKQLESTARQQYVSSFGIALIYDMLGERDPALVAVERAYQDRAVEFAQMRHYPSFKTIASEPRFQTVMQRIGLPLPR